MGVRNTSGLHSNEAVLHDVDSADSVLSSVRIQKRKNTHTYKYIHKTVLNITILKFIEK